MSPGTTHPLVSEIASDAARESGRILESARSEAAAWLASAQAQAGQEREHRLHQAREHAARLSARILATIPLEERRLRAMRIESLLQDLRGRLDQRLRFEAAAHPRATAIRLAAEALRGMEGTGFNIHTSPLSLLEPESRVREELRRQMDLPALAVRLVVDASLPPGGVVVEDAAKRQYTDNRPSSRLDRLWPELRRQIAQVPDLFQRTLEPAPPA